MKKSKKEQKVNITDYIKVTPINRKFAVRMGTKVYVIVDKKIKGMVIIRPRLIAGRVLVAKNEPHFKELNIVKGETEDEYVSTFKTIIDFIVKNEWAHVKKEDKKVEYIWK